MLDLHTHILPGVDDGAKTIDDSVKLLEQMRDQGVSTAVATVHFYPTSAVLEDFLKKREVALNLSNSAADNYGVKILPGAEVLYFGGIGKFTGIKKLTLGRSKYLLLELLGLKKIDDKVIRDIISIKEELGITPIIAHVERYCKYKGYKKLLTALAENRALCQINATFFLKRAENRAVRKLLKAGLVDFVASDCHSPQNRPVRLNEALKLLREISTEETDKIIQKTERLEKELIAVD
ncbi:MAG: hypothetical protein IKN39_03650 [Clostridia bacterium]|nr:hypothetical protein [Clostridia bacterium]